MPALFHRAAITSILYRPCQCNLSCQLTIIHYVCMHNYVAEEFLCKDGMCRVISIAGNWWNVQKKIPSRIKGISSTSSTLLQIFKI